MQNIKAKRETGFIVSLKFDILFLFNSTKIPNTMEGRSIRESLASQNTWHGRCPAPLVDQLPPSQIYERLYDVSRSLKIRAIISPHLKAPLNLK